MLAPWLTLAGSERNDHEEILSEVIRPSILQCFCRCC